MINEGHRNALEMIQSINKRQSDSLAAQNIRYLSSCTLETGAVSPVDNDLVCITDFHLIVWTQKNHYKIPLICIDSCTMVKLNFFACEGPINNNPAITNRIAKNHYLHY